MCMCVSPGRKGCLHTVATGPQSTACSGSTSGTPAVPLSASGEVCLEEVEKEDSIGWINKYMNTYSKYFHLLYPFPPALMAMMAKGISKCGRFSLAVMAAPLLLCGWT